MSRALEELLPQKPSPRLRIYAYEIEDDHHAGLLKIGQTTQDVRQRVKQQLKTAAIKNFKIHVDVSAERSDGTTFSDHQVRERLRRKGHSNAELEWVECSVADVLAAIEELRSRRAITGTHHETFAMRPEQEAAVQKTLGYFQSVWAERPNAVPRFIWNAKMRFGKTFATYQLARAMDATRVLVVTFKPVIEDAWRSDLESHVDFDGWRYFSRGSSELPVTAEPDVPLVYFCSFQDLLGRDRLGNVKAKNAWLHDVRWDLVVFDEYHFGAWRDAAQELFTGEDAKEARKELTAQYNPNLDKFHEELANLGEAESDFLPIESRAFLYLSGTPFKALANGEFVEEQIFNWTYTDEQRAKAEWAELHPESWNPYGALPELRLLTYKMPDELLAVASEGEFNEFDLNEFFAAEGNGDDARFRYEDDVQTWLDIIRGAYAPTQVDNLKAGASRPPFPYSDVRLRPYLNHSLWFLPDVASCHAMAKLLRDRQNIFFHEYKVLTVAGPGAGVGSEALPPVRDAIGSGLESKTITLTCGKLTTGVTVPQWSSILMLRNLNAPETYFQAAFRVQSPWSIRNPNGDDPNEEEVLKPVCFVFDFAPTRALRQVSDYGIGLSPESPNPENAVRELVSFLPVLAYEGSQMVQVDAAGILDFAISGTSATLLARKWESALLVNVDNATLRRVLDNPQAMQAVQNIEGFRALGGEIFETVINRSEEVQRLRNDPSTSSSKKKQRALSEAEREYKRERKRIQEKLIKFATRIPAFMYLTDFRENTLKDVITRLEPDLFRTVTGLSVEDFQLLLSLGVFNSTQMNQAIFAFRRYEDASLSYTGLESHPDLKRIGLFDTVVAVDA